MNFSRSSVADHLPVCALAAALGIALAGCNPKDGVREYADGLAAYEARSLEKAGKLFAKSVAYAPGNVDVPLFSTKTGKGIGSFVGISTALRAFSIQMTPKRLPNL